MRKYRATFEGCSDDILLVNIKDMEGLGKVLFNDETYKTDVAYEINEDFVLSIKFDTIGWVMGIGGINEEINFDEFYTIYYEMKGRTYTPKLVIESDKPFVIPGLFGTKAEEIREKLERAYGRGGDIPIDEIIAFLEGEKLV